MINRSTPTPPRLRPAYGRYWRWTAATLAILAAVCLGGPAATAQVAAKSGTGTSTSGTGTSSREYIYQQAPGTALLIRIDAFEAEFESRVYGPDNRLLKASGIAPLRTGPVFQLIEPPKMRQSLRIEVIFGHRTERSDLDLQWIKMDDSGADNRLLIQGYRLLSFGLERLASGSPDGLTMKVAALSQAADVFDRLGMHELQLWSEYYSSHYLLNLLGDAVSAASQAASVYASASRARLPQLAVAALQLEGAALATQAVQASDVARRARLFELTQSVLGQAEQQAAAMDFQFERISAVYRSGQAFEAAQQHDRALEQFDRAIGFATTSGDHDKANQIRNHAAELHESLGNNAAAIALMRQISATGDIPPGMPEDDAAAPGNGADTVEDPNTGGRAEREMARYLFEQGRLLEKTYRHPEAVTVLRQALALNMSSPSPDLTGPAGLLLGRALYHAGQMDEAVPVLNEAAAMTSASRHEAALREAFDILAAIYRDRGDFGAMREARQRQSMFSKSAIEQASLKYQQALDVLAGGRSPADAHDLLRESRVLAVQAGAAALAHLGALQLCALGVDALGPGQACAGAAGEAAVAALQTGTPQVALQGRLLWSQVLRRHDQAAQAAAEVTRLVDEVQFFQVNLPGVLGAWYWHQREKLFGVYMQHMLGQALTRGGSADGADGTSAFAALAALDRLRNIDAVQDHRRPSGSPGTEPSEVAPNTEALRSLLAAHEDAAPGSNQAQLEPGVARALKALRERTVAAMKETGAGAQRLQRNAARLTPDQALLVYYFADDQAYAWLVANRRVDLVAFPWSAGASIDLARDVEGLRWDAANDSPESFSDLMDRLGRTLISPLRQRLPGTVYFLPTGLMEGFPLDALRWQGRFLAADHQVINLLSLDALGQPAPVVDPSLAQSVFLAGNRRERAGDFALAGSTSAEISAVADHFIGPGLNIIQGAALQWDEFQDQRFVEADIVHLAMPGVLDLRTPDQSRLLLSDNPDGGPAFLAASDIANSRLAAGLAVLSACSARGSNHSAFDIGNRLVAAFLDAGAATVITSLWATGDAAAARFMGQFYQDLQRVPEPAQALAATKARYLADPATEQTGIWAAFQVFLK